MLVITYKNANDDHTIVKVILRQDTTEIEFDVFFMRFQLEQYGKDVTINFKNLDIKDFGGYFYTDANAHKLVKRHVANTLPYTPS